MTRFWIGGYGPDMDGDAAGIGLLEGDEGREPISLAYRGAVAAAASPSWLASHPALDIVYAALEGSGTVQAFARTGERSLARFGAPVEVGAGVCHLAVAPHGRYLVVSCYGDGRVVRVGIDASGLLGETAVADAATDPYGTNPVPAAQGAPAAQGPDLNDVLASLSPAASEPPRSGLLLFDEELGLTPGAPDPVSPAAAMIAAALAPASTVDAPERTSHAHAAAFLPDGRIATTDIGFDLVRVWRPTSAGLVSDHQIVLPHGVGPRHMVVHPSGHLHVVTEYSCEVFTLAAGPDGRWALVAATAVSPAAQAGIDYPSELSRSRNGETLYAGVRGSNTIAALRVRGAGDVVEQLALAESGVDWPRHHLVHDGALLVAGQRSDEISILDLDERTGAPRGIRHRTAAPAPSSILLAR
ncbi:beta-propeller fold lactonase family protein [Microbacterium sp. Bi121]|uniref:lactonase family protein n=1 Tax=Microbacterium sp. Bi121 TaxID=2822348 RepID=UPI001DFFA33D|nr:beta-propeller fold lactonase family protein [Microbacterium sp. Bi121]CAH0222197.1 6-phosphogluconolactonase [Microbacterium sp. Bi121]